MFTFYALPSSGRQMSAGPLFYPVDNVTKLFRRNLYSLPIFYYNVFDSFTYDN